MYPVNLIILGVKIDMFLLVFLYTRLFLGRDSYYVALIYVYMSYNGKKRHFVVGAYETHFSTMTAVRAVQNNDRLSIQIQKDYG